MTTGLLKSNIRSNVAAALLVSAVAFLWTSAALWRQPQSVLEQGIVFTDQGHVLTLADDLLAGRVLYKDVFYQYGPIPAYSYALVAFFFGNSPVTLLGSQQALSIVVAALGYALLRTALTQRESVCFLVIGLYPIILVPGSKLENFWGVDYISLERILLLVSALFWKPPRARGASYAVIQGSLLGLLQGVKFGGAFVAGAALILVDLLYLGEITADKYRRRKWLNVNLVVLGIFLAIEATWISTAFCLLPHQIAQDAIWPQYLLRTYASYNKDVRWPSWHGVQIFVTNQLPGFTAFFLVTFAGLKCFRKTTTPVMSAWKESFGRYAYLGAFYFVGMTIYFQQVWLFYQYLWAMMLAAAWGFHHLRPSLRAALLAFWLPSFALSAQILLPHDIDPALISQRFPSGDELWVDRTTQAQLIGIQDALLSLERKRRAGISVLFFPDGAGLHHFFRMAHAGRFFWFLGALVQRHDEAQFLKDFSNAGAIVVFFKKAQSRPPAIDPEAWSLQYYSLPSFSPELSLAMRGMLSAPIRIDGKCWVFPLDRREP